MRGPATLGHRLALAAIVILALALRLYGIHDPIIDHPGWRQGDEAAIARNFALVEDDLFKPQTDYDGPAPNYVELELQIVPFAAAQLYRLFGVHEIFARLIVVVFSLGTVLLLYFLGKEMFAARAGLIAALAYAIAPGAVYYGRTITPDSDMVFFLTGTLLFWWRWSNAGRRSDYWWAVVFGALAWVAKPPALLALAPIVALAWATSGAKAFARRQLYAFAALTLVPFFVYFRFESSIAEWHWAEGITSQHVLPQLVAELTNPASFVLGMQSAFALLRMLGSTILGPTLFGLALVAPFALPRDDASRLRAWFFAAWGVALAAYTAIVVNVERVDYYLLPWLPLCALLVGGAADNVIARLAPAATSRGGRVVAAIGAVVALYLTTYSDMLQIHPYYTWSRSVYAAATELDRKLDPDCLIVMGHLDPSVLYTIGRKGWEEDPLQWNVHDQTSAIEKGACYYVAIELPRLRANPTLYHFLQRYRRVKVASGWQVYDMRHFARRPTARAEGSASRTRPAPALSSRRSSPSSGTP